MKDTYNPGEKVEYASRAATTVGNIRVKGSLLCRIGVVKRVFRFLWLRFYYIVRITRDSSGTVDFVPECRIFGHPSREKQ